MKIPLKAKVICKDGVYGSVLNLLVDPVKELVTHIVVFNKHNKLHVIIPTKHIDYSSDSVITFEKTAIELDQYPPFIIHDFTKEPLNDSEYADWGSSSTMAYNYIRSSSAYSDEIATKEDIPEGEIKLRKGMIVKSQNNMTIGHIDELIIDDESDLITSLIMKTGHLFGSKEVVVPKDAITQYDSSAVYLFIGQSSAYMLPEVILNTAWIA